MTRLIVVFLLLVVTAVSAAAADRELELSRPDGTVQCGPKPDPAKLLSSARRELRKAGVWVRSIRRGQDGRMRAQVCGAPTGSEIRIRIRESDREGAQALGFAEPGHAPGDR